MSTKNHQKPLLVSFRGCSLGFLEQPCGMFFRSTWGGETSVGAEPKCPTATGAFDPATCAKTQVARRTPRWLDAFVVPEARLIFCQVPKVDALGDWRKLLSQRFQGLHEQRNWTRLRESWFEADISASLSMVVFTEQMQIAMAYGAYCFLHIFLCFSSCQRHPLTTFAATSKDYGRSQALRMMFDSSWTKLVLLRDPLDRLRSVFVSKVNNEKPQPRAALEELAKGLNVGLLDEIHAN